MDGQYKEVYFHEYCETCVHRKNAMTDDPCNECLDHSVNLHSHKPMNYKKDNKKNTKKK